MPNASKCVLKVVQVVQAFLPLAAWLWLPCFRILVTLTVSFAFAFGLIVRVVWSCIFYAVEYFPIVSNYTAIYMFHYVSMIFYVRAVRASPGKSLSDFCVAAALF